MQPFDDKIPEEMDAGFCPFDKKLSQMAAIAAIAGTPIQRPFLIQLDNDFFDDSRIQRNSKPVRNIHIMDDLQKKPRIPEASTNTAINIPGLLNDMQP